MRKTSKVLSVNFLKHFCLKTSKQAFSQKIIQVDCKTLCCYNFMQKIRKNFTCRFFKKLEKPLYGTLWHENPRKFSEILAPSLLKLDDAEIRGCLIGTLLRGSNSIVNALNMTPLQIFQVVYILADVYSNFLRIQLSYLTLRYICVYWYSSYYRFKFRQA